MTPYYLKFTDEAQASAVLNTTVLEVTDEEGNIIVPASVTPNYANTSIIGTIYKPTGEMLTGDDGEYPAMAALEGFHVNVLADAPELSIYQVFPAVPMRVWG